MSKSKASGHFSRVNAQISSQFQRPTLPVPRSRKDINFRDSHRFCIGVARIAPGVIVKSTGQCCGTDNAEEVRALNFVYHLLSIRTPRVLLHPPFPRYALPPWERIHKGVWYFYMDECPGVPLLDVVDAMTPTELDTVAAQLSTILAEMRACKRRFIGSVSGGPLRNFFLAQPWTPKYAFDSVGGFLEHYREAFLQFSGPKYVDELFSKLPRNASIVLTHGDLRPHNILVQGTTITAVIDWEAAGFFPDYWEYAWMHGWVASPGWTHLLARVFPGARRTAEIDAVNAIARAMDLNGC